MKVSELINSLHSILDTQGDLSLPMQASIEGMLAANLPRRPREFWLILKEGEMPRVYNTEQATVNPQIRVREVLEEKCPFEIGDVVRVLLESSHYKGKLGQVYNIQKQHSDSKHWSINVKMKDGGVPMFAEGELTKEIYRSYTMGDEQIPMRKGNLT